MWLQRLSVSNFAGIASADITFGPGVNVLHGPNELGKSTLVRAIRAALLLQATSRAADALRDWHVDAPPSVSLTFQQEEQRIYRVRKTFGTSSGSSSGTGGESYLEFSKNGVDFTQEARGREVDGALEDLLRWGIGAPGGARGRRGTESLISTALLGEQDDVVAILNKSLNDDSAESGRRRLTDALEALAEDPRFKAVLNQVQAQVDEAFTATGKRKSGRASPWVQLRDEMTAAKARKLSLDQGRAKSDEVRQRVQALNEALNSARSDAEALRGTAQALQNAKAQQAAYAEALAEVTAAQAEADRVGQVLLRFSEKAEDVAALTKDLQDAEQARAEALTAQAEAKARLDAARARVLELEDGASEQKRRLHEQELENKQQALVQRIATAERQAEDAQKVGAAQEAVAALRTSIETGEATLAEQQALLEQARERSDAQADEVDELHLQQAFARYLAAHEKVAELQEELEAVQAFAAQGDALTKRAQALREDAAALNAPDADTIAQLRQLSQALEVAQEKLSVGLLVSIVPSKASSLDLEVDGATQERKLTKDQRTDIEADGSITLSIPSFGEVTVRGGNAELVAQAEAAQTSWEAASSPVLGAARCADLDALQALTQKHDAQLREANDVTQQANEMRVRAERLPQLQRDATLAQAEAGREDSALETLLAEYEADFEGGPVKNLRKYVDEYIAELDEPLPSERAIAGIIGEVQQELEERDDLRGKVEALVAAQTATLKAQKAEIENRETALAASAAAIAGDWENVLQNAEAELATCTEEQTTLAQALAAVAEEASTEVDSARAAAADAETIANQTQQVLDTADESYQATRDALARAESALDLMRTAAEAEDEEAAPKQLATSKAALAAIPEPTLAAEDDIAAAERDAERAANLVRQLEGELRSAEGALEQVGGSLIEERTQQAQDAIAAIAEREHNLELEYGAWRLLRDTLKEAEAEDTVHLGSALVEPITERMSALTRGRYGAVEIGPQLDASGIQAAGEERDFDDLSVGTQEQIALMLRLAIAEALDSFIVLDDQLTQTDSGRMDWLRDLLGDVGERIQVVVMTCHPDGYLGSGDDGGGLETLTAVNLAGVVHRNEQGDAVVADAPAKVVYDEATDEVAGVVQAELDVSRETSGPAATEKDEEPAAAPTRRRRRGGAGAARSNDKEASDAEDLTSALRALVDRDEGE